MTHDVQQWLNEIRSLQQRLAHVSQERTDAYEQVTRWHQSYQTEAAQRRTDVQRLQQAIYQLAKENEQLKHQHTQRLRETATAASTGSDSTSEKGEDAHPHETREAEAEAAATITQLQHRLETAIAECDHLSQACLLYTSDAADD